MMRNILFIFLLSTISLFFQSCSNEDTPDLSFGGITIGKQFPDSLLKSSKFKFNGEQKSIDNILPEYEGQLLFSLPNRKSVPLNVKAYGDYKSGKIFEIDIDGFSFSQIGEFYDMLKAKYGDPQKIFNENENKTKSFGSILLNIHFMIKDNEEHNIYRNDPIVIAEWEPAGYESNIKIYCYSYVFTKEEWSDIQVTYFNEEAMKRNLIKYNEELQRKESHNKWMEKKRAQDEYKAKNPEIMNQDF